MAVRKKSRDKYIFFIIYVVAAVGAAILGLLSNSFFAYDIGNQLWANILYLLCISALYIAAYVQELLTKRKTADIVINSFIFPGSLLGFYLFYFLNVYYTLIAIAYSLVLACVTAARFILRIRATQSVPDDSDLDVKPAIAIFAIVLIAMARAMSISYISEIYMAWALIPAVIVTAILGGTALFLLRDLYKAKLIRVGQSVLVAIIGFFVVFVYCETTLGIANFAFDYAEPEIIECTVLDMKVTSRPAQHELKVIIDNTEMWVDVSPSKYFNTSQGDVITVEYYPGAFGFAYVIYSEPSE